MSIINIGTSGFIQYDTINNVCFNGSSGKINLSNIIFDNLYPQFIAYTVSWSGSNPIDSDQIRNNGTSIINLKADTYNFTINSSSSPGNSLGPYSIDITHPEPFIITNIVDSNTSCGSDGNIIVQVSGGTPPYLFSIVNTANNTQRIQQSNTICSFSGLRPSIYSVSVRDQNNCVADISNFNNAILITNKSLSLSINNILPPAIKQGNGYIDFTIVGDGPFELSFNDAISSEEVLFIDMTNTSFITSINDGVIYTYVLDSVLAPGNYTIKVSNGVCEATDNFDIPDLDASIASISIVSNNPTNNLLSNLLLPIFDTIFIPYKDKQNNTALWQLIQKFIDQQKIDIKINDKVYHHKITRNFLNPDCANNETEILRLGNNIDDWFFCFHIGPGINLNTDLSILNSSIFLYDQINNIDYKLTFGLENHIISSNNASLLIGSFIFPGINNAYHNGQTIYLTISNSIPTSISSNDFIIKNIKTNTYLSVYTIGYTTNIYFLENFNVLTQNINTNDTACSIDNETYRYILNIKKLLLAINNVDNYRQLYIYISNINNTGSITTSISAPSVIRQNSTLIPNTYSIDYFTFDDQSDNLQSFYKNNKIIKDIPIINNLSDSYVLIRLLNVYNSSIDYIRINNSNSIEYSKYFSNSINIIREYNSNILPFIQNGDILVSIPKLLPSEVSAVSNITSANVGSISIIHKITTIKQSNDLSNTSKILVNSSPPNVICYLLGPKGYKKEFKGETIFENVVPGVYNIIGDEDYLRDNFLYSNNTRIIVLKNQEYKADIRFQTYRDILFIN